MADPRAEQCPERGVGLGHVKDSEKRPGGACIYCGAAFERFVADSPVSWAADRPQHGICPGYRNTNAHIAAVYLYGDPAHPSRICLPHLAHLVHGTEPK